MDQHYEIWHYQSKTGTNTFEGWLGSLSDVRTRAIVAKRVARLAFGLFGDCRAVGSGVWELRIDFGPGYRVYYAISGDVVVLLLYGGSKRTQPRDIAKAVEYWKDFLRRTDDEDEET